MWLADIEVPNGPVDMSSREPLACYPRRTFYSLSDNLSTQNYRITIADFRLCLICQSYSQADIIAIMLYNKETLFEPTFARLRYFLGGKRPT